MFFLPPFSSANLCEIHQWSFVWIWDSISNVAIMKSLRFFGSSPLFWFPCLLPCWSTMLLPYLSGLGSESTDTGSPDLPCASSCWVWQSETQHAEQGGSRQKHERSLFLCCCFRMTRSSASVAALLRTAFQGPSNLLPSPKQIPAILDSCLSSKHYWHTSTLGLFHLWLRKISVIHEKLALFTKGSHQIMNQNRKIKTQMTWLLWQFPWALPQIFI